MSENFVGYQILQHWPQQVGPSAWSLAMMAACLEMPPTKLLRPADKRARQGAPFRQLLLQARVDAWHGYQNGRAHRRNILGQLGDLACVGHATARHHWEVAADGPFERVGQRQKRKEQIIRVSLHVPEYGLRI